MPRTVGQSTVRPPVTPPTMGPARVGCCCSGGVDGELEDDRGGIDDGVDDIELTEQVV